MLISKEDLISVIITHTETSQTKAERLANALIAVIQKEIIPTYQQDQFTSTLKAANKEIEKIVGKCQDNLSNLGRTCRQNKSLGLSELSYMLNNIELVKNDIKAAFVKRKVKFKDTLIE